MHEPPNSIRPHFANIGGCNAHPDDGGDEDDVMPPPETHKKITKAQKETLRKWIEQGAPYEKHWSSALPVDPKHDPAELAALASVASTILCMDETVTKP